MNRNAVLAALIVITHHAISIVHGWAHKWLGVDLEPWQWAYVYSVIVAAPLVAMVLYFTRWQRVGALLLGLSMLGSLLFGVYFHFIAVSHDNISHLPEGDAQGLFVATAFLLVPVEAAGTVLGFWNWKQGGKARSDA
jgi:amino acid permease